MKHWKLVQSYRQGTVRQHFKKFHEVCEAVAVVEINIHTPNIIYIDERS